MADNSITGTMVILSGQETALTGTLTGSTINVSGGGNSFTLEFDADESGSSNNLLLDTISGFIGTMSNASGTSDVIGTTCQPD